MIILKMKLNYATFYKFETNIHMKICSSIEIYNEIVRRKNLEPSMIKMYVIVLLGIKFCTVQKSLFFNSCVTHT